MDNRSFSSGMYKELFREQRERSDLYTYLLQLSPSELASLTQQFLGMEGVSSVELRLIVNAAEVQVKAAYAIGDMETRQDYLTVLSVTDTYCYWREGDERGDQEVYFRILSREDEQAFDDLASATIS